MDALFHTAAPGRLGMLHTTDIARETLTKPGLLLGKLWRVTDDGRWGN